MNKIIAISIFLIAIQVNSQNFGNLSGNTQLYYQNFQEDIIIGAESRPSYSSGYTNLLYNYRNFIAGGRLELYRNPIPGLEQYEGYGISHKFVQFKNNFIDITTGNFYDEFGSGLVFRTYFDPNLGVDNSMNGLVYKWEGFCSFEELVWSAGASDIITL